MSLHPSVFQDTDPDGSLDVRAPVRGRARVLLSAAVGPLVISYTMVAALLALVISAATRAEFSTLGVLSAAMPGWLAAHQVPLTISGREFGALPLLPTIAVILLTARAAASAAGRLAVRSAREAGQVVMTVAIAHAVTGGAVALITSAAPFLLGVLIPGAVAAGAATVGLARRCLLADLLDRMDEVTVRGLRAGLLGFAALMGAGALLVLAGLVGSWSTVRMLFEANAPGAGNGFGMFLLSAAYLPNAVVAGSSFVAGPGVAVGELSATPLHLTGGPVPGVPLLAALPETNATWWPVLLLVPLGVGALVGWALREACEDPFARLRAVGAAAVVVAGGCLVAGWAAGGRLADGPFDPLTVHPWSLGVAMLLWVALPAASVAWWAGPRPELTPSRGLLADAAEAEEAAEEQEDTEDTETDEAQAAEETEEDSEDAEPVAAQPDEPDDEPEPDLTGEIEN